MATETDLLLGALADAPDGLTRAELLGRLRARIAYLGAHDVERVLRGAGAAIRIEGDRIYAARDPADGGADVGKPPVLPRRFVSFDLESVVRAVVKEPYRQQHVFQIGAVRFGPDTAWNAEQPEFAAFTRLPNEEAESLIYRVELRDRYKAEAEPLAEVLERFRHFCDGAEAIVAYNGVAHDFRMLEDELRRSALPTMLGGRNSPRLVDGLYLAQALWPIPPRQHRLKQLLDRLAIDVTEMQWHDALDDSKMVVELLEYGARETLPALGDDVVKFLRAAGKGSDAWELLLSLAGLDVSFQVYDQIQTSQVLESALTARPSKEPLRPAPPDTGVDAEPAEGPRPPSPIEVAIPKSLRQRDGRVSIERLIATVKGQAAEPRESQRVMVAQLRDWLEAGTPALCEAPTGTGKSFAILAAALDWIDADPGHKVIISTFTKQLQSQLATDIEALSAAIPELAKAADMVKGAANRLSLRALVLALAELTEPDPRKHRRGKQDFSDDKRYRDLIVYLALRFIAEGKPTEEWEARSVDRVDVPAFFDEYCPRRLSLYLSSLSQAENEDYRTGRGGIGRYTMTVREALDSHRLLVANHALLLAHLDDLDDIGDQTLLFVDEAHELENAATNALSEQLDSGTLAELAVQVGEWAQDQSGLAGASQLADAVTNLDRYLEDGRLETAAMRAFDTAERDPLGRAVLRTVTIASPVQGDAFVQPMLHLAEELRTCRRIVGLMNEAFRRLARNPPADPFDLDRFQALWTRTGAADTALFALVRDTDAVLAPPDVGGQQFATTTVKAMPPAPPEAMVTQPTDPGLELVDEGEEQGAQLGDELVALESGEEAELEAVRDAEDVVIEETAPEPDRSNRVVFAEELDEARPGRVYRFRLVTAPIELRREGEWQRFKRRFARTYYVSATLRVAERWDFIRGRLDLQEDEVRALDLPSPFDAERQAELVCLEDFPSWSEHVEAAMHTVAHQLSGYAAELIPDGGANGAMVLTTSRASAAGVFDWLARLRVGRAQNYPLISAGIEGNQRAVETFSKVGGVLVGTRGLWQGVDIADPTRIRLVWINKLPFAPFADPIVAARLALEVERAEHRGDDDPEGYANEHYYLPLAALSLRQAVGRLIRSREHRGVIVISDRKLAGPTRLRRLYRQVFLGSLDPGLMRPDPETGEPWLGNVSLMRDGWKRIFSFLARENILDPGRAAELSTDTELTRFTELPETLAILEQALSQEEEREHRDAGTLVEELIRRSTVIAGELKSAGGAITLKPKQEEAIAAIAKGKDVLAVLPTGYGKSYVFQLPALCLAGVTIVVSPLVSLMTDQALELNRTIGGRVRALVAPMRESNSRTGKSEVEQELKGLGSHGIKLVYLSPERLCQRQFQEWLRIGVQRGIVRRIALDEAHTFVQWGDDFRPSVRRAENFVRGLKRDHPELQLIALTATANETVREGLRSTIFGLAPGETRDDFAFVQANPLRPELAIYRRVLPQHQGGPASVAGLVERVVDALEGHAIFYCLTVRQVEALHAHLSDYLQGHAVDVLRYHGRLTDAEKTGTANHFKQAPPKGEDGYRRMVVVATSAFGLGIDRPDIRAVFCVSPPTDLAALYQQLGRAGRDRAVSPELPGPYTAALALSYPRAQRTISFMTQRRTSDELIARIASLVLAADGVISSRELARDLIDEDLREHRLSLADGAKDETLDTYQTGVLRVLAELSLRELVSDLGDFPRTVEIRRGDYEPDTHGLREVVDAVMAGVPADRKIELVALHAALGPRFPDEFPDAGSLWHALLELHTLGHLDVSQRPNREQLTGVEVRSRELPEDLVRGLSRRQLQLQSEVGRLRDWYGGEAICCNEGLRQYFAADDLPSGTCATDACRCSACWNRTGLTHAVEPKLYEAFTSTDLRPASATARGRRRSEEQLDKLVWQLLWHNYAGLVENIIRAVLRGDDHYYSRAERKRKPLWPRLLLSRVRGRKPGLRSDELQAALGRLIDRGEVTQTGASRYRLARYVLQDEMRAAAAEGDLEASAPAP